MSCYKRLPVSFTHGRGAWLYDSNDNAYLDALSGIAVTILGHSHPELNVVIAEAAAKLLHCSNLFQIPAQEELAELLCNLTGLEEAFFTNSGTEAVETAIKLSRLYGSKIGISCPELLTTQGAFHGRSISAISAANKPKYCLGFAPLLPGFHQVPFDDLEAVEQAFSTNDKLIGIMLEPIQGEGGIIIPKTNYLLGLRKLCDQYKRLLILDEVQTGMGRTGKLFNYQHSAIIPDILISAKGLANGIPIGATLCAKSLKGTFSPGQHGSTFGGNPFACTVALNTIKILQREDYATKATANGMRLQALLNHKCAELPLVTDIRGQGLMLGVALNRPCRPILEIGLQHQILFNIASESVLRILPPLIIDDTEVQEISERLYRTIKTFSDGQS